MLLVWHASCCTRATVYSLGSCCPEQIKMIKSFISSVSDWILLNTSLHNFLSILYTSDVTGSHPSVSQCKQNFHRWKFWILIQHLLSLWEAQKRQAFTRPSATLPASPSTSNLPSSSRSYDLRLAMLRRKSPGKSKISMDRASGNECYSRLVQLMRITESLLNCDWHPCNTKAEQSMLYLLLPTLFNAV